MYIQYTCTGVSSHTAHMIKLALASKISQIYYCSESLMLPGQCPLLYSKALFNDGSAVCIHVHVHVAVNSKKHPCLHNNAFSYCRMISISILAISINLSHT